MYAKLVVLACLVAVSLAKWHGPLAGGLPADLYPAGISPQACPNFPNCDNPAVALTSNVPAHGAGGWNGAGAGAGAGGWNGAGAGAGAGGWNGGHNNGAWNGAGAGGWNGAGAAGWNGAGAGAGGWNGGHNNGGWNGGHQSALDSGEYTGDGDYRGEGLAESGAYGNGYH